MVYEYIDGPTGTKMYVETLPEFQYWKPEQIRYGDAYVKVKGAGWGAIYIYRSLVDKTMVQSRFEMDYVYPSDDIEASDWRSRGWTGRDVFIEVNAKLLYVIQEQDSIYD